MVDAKTQVDAAKFLVDHVIGKATQRTTVELSPMEKTQQIFAAAIVLDDGRPQGHLSAHAGPVLEGEYDEAERDTTATATCT